MKNAKFARLGSRVQVDLAPGTFIDNDTLEQLMIEEGRPMIGGARVYGSEYDGYYQDRRWDVPSHAPEPTFTPTPTRAQAQAMVKKAAADVAKKIVGRAKARVKAARSAANSAAQAGLGSMPFDTYLTAADVRSVGIPCSTPGMKVRSKGKGRGLAIGKGRGPLRGGAMGLGMLTLGGDDDDLPDKESVDLLTAVREIYGTTKEVKPLAEFIGAHPVGTIAILMMVIGIWAGIASFIGAGGVDVLKQALKK